MLAWTKRGYSGPGCHYVPENGIGFRWDAANSSRPAPNGAGPGLPFGSLASIALSNSGLIWGTQWFFR